MEKNKKNKAETPKDLVQVQTGNIDILTIQLLSEINQKLSCLLLLCKEQKNG